MSSIAVAQNYGLRRMLNKYKNNLDLRIVPLNASYVITSTDLRVGPLNASYLITSTDLRVDPLNASYLITSTDLRVGHLNVSYLITSTDGYSTTSRAHQDPSRRGSRTHVAGEDEKT